MEYSDFSLKSEETCDFFDKRGYPASVAQAGHNRAQQTYRQSALQTSQKENNNRIPFTLTTRSAYQTIDQPGTFKCARARCKTCLSFATLRNCRDPSDPLRSLIILPVPQPMPFTA